MNCRTLFTLAIGALAIAVAPAHAGSVPSTTTVAASATSMSYGTAVTFTATVTGFNPTGTVTFSDTTGPVGMTTTTVLASASVPAGSARPLGPYTTSGTATATITVSTLVTGTSTLAAEKHTITAAYSGDNNNAASVTAPLPAAQLVITVSERVTATALTSSGSPTNYGQVVTLTATVTGGVNASGTVSFSNGAVLIGTSAVTVTTGVAVLFNASLPAGTDTITAKYSGDSNNLTSTSGTVNQVVNKVTTTMSLVASPNPAAYGQAVTLTANVTGALPLGGSVQFLDGATVLGTQTPGSSGAAGFSTTSLAPGIHTLLANYSGDVSHFGSSAVPIQLTINHSTTTTTLMISPNPAKSGQLVTLTAQVSTALATGMVTFTDGPTTLGSSQLANGLATLGVSTFTSGTHSIIATYSGDTNYSGSASGFTNLMVGQAPVTLISSQNPSSAGQSVTFTVIVTGNTPTGTVTFLDGSTTLMQVTLSGGTATYTTSALQAGDHQITGQYSGDTNNASAFSAVLAQIVGSVIPQTGYWWNPAQAGSGFVIEQQGGSLFAASFLYDISGRATWYGIGPGAISNSTFTGTLEGFSGGQTLTGAYQPAVSGASGGAVTVSFTSPTQGTITWPGGTIPIERYDFGPGGSQATQPAGTPQTGWWWAPTEGGRGYSIEVQGNMLFLAGYMYDSQGNPIWYASGPTALSSASTYQGVWQQYGNGQTLTGSYQSPTIVNADVGSITIQFTSTTAGTLTFPDGRQIAIQRYAF